MPEPKLATRAVFAPEDFELLRAAVLHYLRDGEKSVESAKYVNLYHRLGRLC
jgi:hypothetical protein